MTAPNHAIPGTQAAIDFGISDPDVVARIGVSCDTGMNPMTAIRTKNRVRDILAAGGIRFDHLDRLAVTGGRHKLLPAAVGPNADRHHQRGAGHRPRRPGHIGFARCRARAAAMVVSAGSGTALIKAQGDSFAHVSGSGVGGGTMLGLARLLLDTLGSGRDRWVGYGR